MYKIINNSKEINNGIFIEEIFKEDIIKNNYLISVEILVSSLIIYFSDNSSINYAIPCLRENNFSDIEEKLYQNYPELRYKPLIFFNNGRLIERSSTIMENGIKNGDKILIVINE